MTDHMSPDLERRLRELEDDSRVARLAEARDKVLAEHGDDPGPFTTFGRMAKAYRAEVAS